MVALCLALRHVLHVLGHGYPSMHPIFIDRERGCGEARFCEGSDGDSNTGLDTFNDVVDSRAAVGAEGERGPSAFVSNTDILRACSADFDRFSQKPGLSRKHAPGSTLTRMAMTDRHPDRFARDFCRELAATTRCDSMGHGGMEEGRYNMFDKSIETITFYARESGTDFRRLRCGSPRSRDFCSTQYFYGQRRE